MSCVYYYSILFFFFNHTATTEIYTLSLHDALPISRSRRSRRRGGHHPTNHARPRSRSETRSEEHTSELQSHSDLVCRLLLEKKKTNTAQYSSEQIFCSDTASKRRSTTSSTR